MWNSRFHRHVARVKVTFSRLVANYQTIELTYYNSFWMIARSRIRKKEGKIIFKAIYSNLYFYTIIEIKYTMVSFFKPACVSSYF